MKSARYLLLLGVVSLSSAGCTLITDVDRSKIGAGGTEDSGVPAGGEDNGGSGGSGGAADAGD